MSPQRGFSLTANIQKCFCGNTNIVLFFLKVIKVLFNTYLTTYLCEGGFFFLYVNENKYSNRLNTEADTRIYLSSLKPCIEEIYNKQYDNANNHFCFGKYNYFIKIIILSQGQIATTLLTLTSKYKLDTQ